MKLFGKKAKSEIEEPKERALSAEAPEAEPFGAGMSKAEASGTKTFKTGAFEAEEIEAGEFAPEDSEAGGPRAKKTKAKTSRAKKQKAKKPRGKTSLRSKTMKMLGVILLFFSLVFLMSTLIIQRRENDDFKIRTTETAVENVVSSINSTIDTYNYMTRLIMMDSSVLRYLDAKKADKILAYDACRGMYDIMNMYGNISYIESVYIFRNDWEYTNTGKAEYFIARDHPEWKRIYWQKGARTISVSGNGLIRKNNGKPTLTLARGIYDIHTQKRKGILVMNISGSCFDETLSLQSTSGICVLDQNGTWLCGDSEAADFYDTAYNSDRMVCNTVQRDGNRIAVAGKRSVDSLLVIGYTAHVSNRLPWEIVAALLLAFLAFWVSTLYSALFISKNMSGPIVSLWEAMERTKLSGWQPIVEEMPNTDLSRLADSYNSMIEYLNQLFDRLHQEEEMIRKAEMRVLQEQIKPHFLYNTLETINYMAVQEKAERTYDALETLGSFYRSFLSGGDREIPFLRELQITRDYLSLQKLRYGDSFDDAYEIDENAFDCTVPKLILQPLVENSIYHGVRLKGEMCLIRVGARKEKEGLYLTVYDTGVGMSAEKIREVLDCSKKDFAEGMESGGKGFGLAGTIARIRYFCNRDDVVSIRSEEGEYTEIEIFIPNDVGKEGEEEYVQGNDH